jgi:hypothetical protein
MESATKIPNFMNLAINQEKATILIPVSEIAIPKSVVEYAEEHGYILKSEFHITLISFQNGKKILKAMHDRGGFLFDDVVKLANAFHFGVVFESEYFLLERTIPSFILHGQVQTPEHTRRSIIQKISVPDMNLFFGKLEKLTGVQFENPIEHITLFTWSDYEPESRNGIALNSQVDFDKYKKAVLN